MTRGKTRLATAAAALLMAAALVSPTAALADEVTPPDAADSASNEAVLDAEGNATISDDTQVTLKSEVPATPVEQPAPPEEMPQLGGSIAAIAGVGGASALLAVGIGLAARRDRSGAGA